MSQVFTFLQSKMQNNSRESKRCMRLTFCLDQRDRKPPCVTAAFPQFSWPGPTKFPIPSAVDLKCRSVCLCDARWKNMLFFYFNFFHKFHFAHREKVTRLQNMQRAKKYKRVFSSPSLCKQITFFTFSLPT